MDGRPTATARNRKEAEFTTKNSSLPTKSTSGVDPNSLRTLTNSDTEVPENNRMQADGKPYADAVKA